jgi:hypothetical protein
MTSAPDLDSYSDAESMRTLLQAQLPGFAAGPLHVDALQVRSARRNTSRGRNPSPLALCYELQVSDRHCGRRGAQLLLAQVYRPGLSGAAFARHRRRALVAPAFGQALVHLPALNLLLWALPNDPELPQLAQLLDPACAAHMLPPALAGVRCDEVQIELLRYAAQERATLRYTFKPRHEAGVACTLYAKTFADPRAQDVHARFAYFWRQSQINAEAPLVAQPLGFGAATRTLWQAAAAGVPLLQVLAQVQVPQDPAPQSPAPTAAAGLLGRVASALAAVHRAPLGPSAAAQPRTAAQGVQEARRRQTKIGRASPALAVRAARVADAIEAHAPRQAARALSLIHGDFHPDQIWVHDGRVVLFDFDEFTWGDPMEDLATFVLKLQQAGVAAGLCAAFTAHYAACAPARFDARSLDWHLALQGLKQCSRAFVFQQPGWAQAMERRLAASEVHAAALAEECVS